MRSTQRRARSYGTTATGSPILAPPATYVAGGKQFVAVASGQPGNQTVPEVQKVSPNGSFLTAYSL